MWIVVLLLAIIVVTLLRMWDVVKVILGLALLWPVGAVIWTGPVDAYDKAYLTVVGVVIFAAVMWSLYRAIIVTEDDELAEKGLKKCPACAEHIKLEALVCKHCGKDFSESEEQLPNRTSPPSHAPQTETSEYKNDSNHKSSKNIYDYVVMGMHASLLYFWLFQQ